MKPLQALADLTEENAATVATVFCKDSPEWGTKRFQYKAQPLMEGRYAHVVGSGSNSAVLHVDEMHFWAVASFHVPDPE